MHRLFVAIRPPRPVREILLDLMGGVRGARWPTDEQLHLTLRFIGEVDRHIAEDIHAALGSIHQPSFEIALNGIGSFDRRGEAVTLWAGVTPHEPLKALHKKVDQACLKAGVAPDRRAYLPHITIARLGRAAGPVQGLMESAGAVASPAFPVDSFCLFESELTPNGPIYSILERYKLA
ncbi:RNA 2',3'-cyclic phosphodiesterase [Sphingosinicella rhizophila]|uniref:RNA 2',3'-cyclic phosphodiesterase n=1 Tax=Sphingosinicella rhizophila TaxID=3050082 RepID=A0ABU3Q4H1_9SPHN|nr:RNA 2',3'-cyclic phosphodiesterase [Sphingosinicella sp. GR2756]MDT9598311.1 RNA 2',3'-cyclic phosphodiesterase [Sphingosinicella sp. GR2756]